MAIDLSMDTLQLVVFHLGGEEFGIDINQVQEIIRMPEITQIPQAPDFVDGVINLRGKILVVLDLNKKFNIGGKEIDKDSRIVVVEVNGNTLGVVVDSVSEVLQLDTASIEKAPEIIASKVGTEYIQGVGKLEDRLLILLNIERILSVDEIGAVQNLDLVQAEVTASETPDVKSIISD